MLWDVEYHGAMMMEADALDSLWVLVQDKV
jgi:hypothetical protein